MGIDCNKRNTSCVFSGGFWLRTSKKEKTLLSEKVSFLDGFLEKKKDFCIVPSSSIITLYTNTKQ